MRDEDKVQNEVGALMTTWKRRKCFQVGREGHGEEKDRSFT